MKQTASPLKSNEAGDIKKGKLMLKKLRWEGREERGHG